MKAKKYPGENNCPWIEYKQIEDTNKDILNSEILFLIMLIKRNKLNNIIEILGIQ
tara:strand:- start:7432 stop:7596 length:165 start_codon:yes stop_codon:yes gene_type:complete